MAVFAGRDQHSTCGLMIEPPRKIPCKVAGVIIGVDCMVVPSCQGPVLTAIVIAVVIAHV